VLAQTFADFELIVIDDNSPDDTAALVARYSDPRLRYLRNEKNLGPEGNWNRCLAEARGMYFKLLPHDDVLMPECLARQVQVLECDQHEHLALVFCARTIVDQRARTLMTRAFPGAGEGILPARRVVRSCLRHGTNVIGEPGGVLCRRALTRAIGTFDARQPYLIDLDYWFRLLLKGDAYYLPQPLVAFRVSPGSWSVAIGRGQRTEFCGFIERVARNPQYAISGLDLAVGRFMAGVNNLLRRLLYRFVLIKQ